MNNHDKRPVIALIATGGTIAGSGASATGSAYQSGELDVSDLLAAVPGLDQQAELQPEQLFNIGSQDLDPEHWQQLSARINVLAADPNIDGIVICHGTDTLEETAWYLQLTVDTAKPVVLTAAMRPATALSADGPLNLFNAVVVAANPASVGKGVLATLNQQIFSALDLTKSHTTAVQTFAMGSHFGPIGTVFDAKVQYYTQPLATRPALFIDQEELPKVGIIFGQCGANSEPVQAYIDAGYQGIVVAGVGNGNIHHGLVKALSKAREAGLQIVRSSRVPFGEVTANGEFSDRDHGFICSRHLSPQCARILLMLGLAAKSDRAQLQQYFNFMDTAK